METLPLLRVLLKIGPLDLLEVSGADDAVAFGDLVMSGPELYYLLRYLREASFVDFVEEWAMGPSVVVMHLKLTRIGRARVNGASQSA